MFRGSGSSGWSAGAANRENRRTAFACWSSSSAINSAQVEYASIVTGTAPSSRTRERVNPTYLRLLFGVLPLARDMKFVLSPMNGTASAREAAATVRERTAKRNMSAFFTDRPVTFTSLPRGNRQYSREDDSLSE